MFSAQFLILIGRLEDPVKILVGEHSLRFQLQGEESAGHGFQEDSITRLEISSKHIDKKGQNFPERIVHILHARVHDEQELLLFTQCL